MVLVPTKQAGRPACAFEGFGGQWLFSRFPYAGRGLHSHYVLQTQVRNSLAELPVNAVSGIGYDHTRHNAFLHCLPDLPQSDLWFGLKPNLLRNASGFPLLRIVGPNLRQVESPCNGETVGPGCN
jgi:hypothetical protein